MARKENKSFGIVGTIVTCFFLKLKYVTHELHVDPYVYPSTLMAVYKPNRSRAVT